MADTRTASDTLYHRLFSHPEMVADLLRSFLDPALLAELDLDRMRRHNTKFTAQKGARRRGDVVWEIPTNTGGNLFVMLILEFQSTVDEWMALRIDVYTGLLYQQLVAERKLKAADGLPPVLPIVLFNGDPRWHAATSLRDLIRVPKDSLLWNFQPEMRYYVIDEGMFPEEELAELHSLTAILFRMEHPVSPESMLKVGQDVVAWFGKHPNGPPVKQLFRELLVAGLKRLNVAAPLPPIPEDLQEVVTMLATHVDRWAHDIEYRGIQIGKQEGLQIGEQRGLQIGKQEGEQKGLRDGAMRTLLRLIQRRFGPAPEWVHAKLAGADLELLGTWTERILDAQSLDDIFQ